MVTKVSAKGQVVIPKAVRERLGLRQGMRLSVEVAGTEVRLAPLPRQDWRRWQGRFRKLPLLEDRNRERQIELKRERQRS